MQEKTSAEKVIGKPMDRVDGRLKVTGGAKYAFEFPMPNLARAVILDSTIARGRIKRIDARAAEKAPGVIAVITHENQPPMSIPTNPPAGDSKPLLDPVIRQQGQHVAVVVAETFEQADYASCLIKVEYARETPDVDYEKHLDTGFVPKTDRKVTTKKGDAAAGLAASSHRIEKVYRTPPMHHNPIEPHATVAMWRGDELTVYDATQGVINSAGNFAQQFNVDAKAVHLMDPFVGGGFGCKGQSWPHSPICAMAAKVVGRPVRLEITRRQMFTNNGHRPPTHQDVKLGADDGGKLLAQTHAAWNHTSQVDEFTEPTGNVIRSLYASPSLEVTHEIVRVDVPAPTYMRAPGESSGSFSIETAMDELAYELGVDPLELRLRNYAEVENYSGKSFSSKSLRQCYDEAARAFGWNVRNPKPGTMRTADGMLVGLGMATATYPSNFNPSSAKATIGADGQVLVEIATQDLGTGTYTILTQIAAETMGVDPGKVRVKIGDSTLPASGTSGGSQTATSAGSSVMVVCQALKSEVTKFATKDEATPLWNLGDNEYDVKDGVVFAKADPKRRMSYAEILKRYGKREANATSFVKPGLERGTGQSGSPLSMSDPNKSDGSAFHGFGAHFCEVHIDPDLRMVRVARWNAAFALGKVLNEKTLRSQMIGGIVWGIGMGLLEETYLDARYGRFMNSNLAEYHVPVNRDTPPIDVILVPEKDDLVSPLGAKGGGEIGIVGAAAALGNAIFHATGKRVRELPITLDKIL